MESRQIRAYRICGQGGCLTESGYWLPLICTYRSCSQEGCLYLPEQECTKKYLESKESEAADIMITLFSQ